MSKIRKRRLTPIARLTRLAPDGAVVTDAGAVVDTLDVIADQLDDGVQPALIAKMLHRFAAELAVVADASALAHGHVPPSQQREAAMTTTRSRKDDPMSDPHFLRIGGVVWKSPDGEYPECVQCTARTRAGKRCRLPLDHGQITHRTELRIDGGGHVRGYDLDDRWVSPDLARRFLAQRCRTHGTDAPAAVDPEWVRFDIEADAEHVRYDDVDLVTIWRGLTAGQRAAVHTAAPALAAALSREAVITR